MSVRVLMMLCASMSICSLAVASVQMTVQVDRLGVNVSPMLHGLFFEEINRAGDGGIYAEMLANRSFEDDWAIERYWRDLPQQPPLYPEESWGQWATMGPRPIYAWSLFGGQMALCQGKPLNPNNPTAIRIALSGKSVLYNSGFPAVRTPPGTPGVGLKIEPRANYRLSLYARAEDFSSPLLIRLEGRYGIKILAEQRIGTLTEEWKHYSVTLTARGGDPFGRLAIEAEGDGTLWLDMVSLFPEQTWKGRPNGLRKDLMERIEAMKPTFVRFPGGCFVEGDTLENAWRWKKTIGDIAQRLGTWTYRGYLSTDGLGMHEYLLMCEDLNAEPLLVVNCGMSHQEQRQQPTDLTGMEEYVQDALDAIEYCNGPVDSPWGSRRAEAGHPEPFDLKYIEIGNENGRQAYIARYPLFQKAISARYPEMVIISNGWRGTAEIPIAIIDPHFYPSPEEFMTKYAVLYDKLDRSSAKVYVGEYAAQAGAGEGNLLAALGEAVFMIGLERNGDQVVMSSYAPLLRHHYWRNWNPNAIVFDQYRIYGTPSYYLQTMIGDHVPDVVLPVELSGSAAVGSADGSPASFFAGAGLKRDSHSVILKVVNAADTQQTAQIRLEGVRRVRPQAKATVLSGLPAEENSFEQPDKVVPKKEMVYLSEPHFEYVFLPYSVTFFVIAVD